MTSPIFLYHGSTNKNLEKIEPRAVTVRDVNDGQVVFATPSQARASLFIIPSDDSWTNKSFVNGVFYHVIADKNKYLENDKGGAIYTLNTDNFVSDERGKEWVSKVSVKPIDKELFNSGIDAMEKYGVKVVFCDYKFLKKFQDLLKNDLISEAASLINNLLR
jgi:hypothetical protein